jgi:hypothetical protein
MWILDISSPSKSKVGDIRLVISGRGSLPADPSYLPRAAPYLDRGRAGLRVQYHRGTVPRLLVRIQLMHIRGVMNSVELIDKVEAIRSCHDADFPLVTDGANGPLLRSIFAPDA